MNDVTPHPETKVKVAAGEKLEVHPIKSRCSGWRMQVPAFQATTCPPVYFLPSPEANPPGELSTWHSKGRKNKSSQGFFPKDMK